MVLKFDILAKMYYINGVAGKVFLATKMTAEYIRGSVFSFLRRKINCPLKFLVAMVQ